MAIAREHLGGDFSQDDGFDHETRLSIVRGTAGGNGSSFAREDNDDDAVARTREEEVDSDDASLLLGARQGNQGAFDLFYRRHWDAVLGYCIRRVRDRSLAEELTQDVFLKVFRNLLAPWPGVSLRPWLLKVAQNLCVDHQRAAHAPVVSFDEVHARPNKQVEHNDPTADQATFRIVQRHLMTLAAQALAVLTVSDRRLLVQHDVEGVSYDELAGREGLSINALRNRVFRARTVIRDNLRSLCEDVLGLCVLPHEIVTRRILQPMRTGMARIDQSICEAIGSAASFSTCVALAAAMGSIPPANIPPLPRMEPLPSMLGEANAHQPTAHLTLSQPASPGLTVSKPVAASSQPNPAEEDGTTSFTMDSSSQNIFLDSVDWPRRCERVSSAVPRNSVVIVGC